MSPTMLPPLLLLTSLLLGLGPPNASALKAYNCSNLETAPVAYSLRPEACVDVELKYFPPKKVIIQLLEQVLVKKLPAFRCSLHISSKVEMSGHLGTSYSK